MLAYCLWITDIACAKAWPVGKLVENSEHGCNCSTKVKNDDMYTSNTGAPFKADRSTRSEELLKKDKAK
jgi:hypothetical protein